MQLCDVDKAPRATTRVLHTKSPKRKGDDDGPGSRSRTLMQWEKLKRGDGRPLSFSAIQQTLQSLQNRSSTSHELLAGLLREAARQFNDITPQSVIHILKSCARLSFQDKEAIRHFVSLCGERAIFAEGRISGLSPQEITCCVASLAHLHKKTRNSSFSLAETSHGLLQKLSPQIASMLRNIEFDARSISKIIYSVGVLQFRAASLVESIIGYIESVSQLGGLSPTEFSCLVYGLSQLGISDYYSLQPLTRLLLEDMELGAFSNVDVASLLYSAAKLKWRNDGVHEKVAKEACRWERLAHYDGKTFASVCLSLGRLSYSCPADIQRLTQHINQLGRIEQLDSRGLSSVVLGMHLLDVHDHELWEQLSRASVYRLRLKSFNEEGLAMVLYSFGHRVHQPFVWKALTAEILSRRKLASFRDVSIMTMIHGLLHQSEQLEPLLRALFREITREERLIQLSDRNLVGALTAMSQLKWQTYTFLSTSGRALSQAILQRTTHSPQSIALTIYSLGRMQSCRLASRQEITSFIRRALKPDVASQFTSQGWACLVFGLGEMRFNDWKTLNDILAQIFRADLARFSTFELCSVFFGLGKCGYHNGRVTGFLLGEILREERCQDMNSGIMTTLILALAYHGLEDANLLDEVMKRVLDPATFADFTKKDLSIILHALAILQYSNTKSVEKLVQSLISAENRSSISQEEREQLPWIIHSLHKLGLEDARIWELLLDELKQDGSDILSRLTPAGLSSILSALSTAKCTDTDLTKRLLESFLGHDGIDNGSLLKTLEAVATLGHRHAIDNVAQRLLFRCRIKRMSAAAMLRFAESFFRSHGLKESSYANGFLTEFLFFRNGILFSRLPDHRLLQLVASLRQFMDRSYPYLPQLIAALKAEVFSVHRRDSIRMDDMIEVTLKLRAAEESLKTQPSTFSLVP